MKNIIDNISHLDVLNGLKQQILKVESRIIETINNDKYIKNEINKKKKKSLKVITLLILCLMSSIFLYITKIVSFDSLSLIMFTLIVFFEICITSLLIKYIIYYFNVGLNVQHTYIRKALEKIAITPSEFNFLKKYTDKKLLENILTFNNFNISLFDVKYIIESEEFELSYRRSVSRDIIEQV